MKKITADAQEAVNCCGDNEMTDLTDNLPEIREFTLEFLQMHSQCTLSDAVLASARIDTARQLARNLAGQLISLLVKMPCERLPDQSDSVEMIYPTSWWQMFKDRFYPKWLLKWFPVKTESVTLTTKVSLKAVYPELPLIMPDCGRYKICIQSEKEIGYSSPRALRRYSV